MMRTFLFRRPAGWLILPLNVLAAIIFFLIFPIDGRSQEPAQNSDGLAPLPLLLPPPTLKGTPQNLPTNTTALPPTDKTPAPFYAPKGVKNIALGKPVTGSNPNPVNGDLPQITDGKKQAVNENVVTLRRGLQWVQIDLQGEYNLYAIVLWHDFTTAVVYRDVLVQVSDDPEFATGVHTLFNNDQSNRSGLGAGTDREYFENPLTGEGKLVDAKGIKARYLRCYSHGSSDNALNTYIEIEAYGLPAS
jgi:hypothetical protein